MERFSNICLLKSLMNYPREEEKLSGQIDSQIAINLRSVRLSSLTRNISLLFTMLVSVLILGIGGKSVISGAMTIGALVAFIQYTNPLFDPFRDMMGLYFYMVRASVSMERIYEVMSIPGENAGHAGHLQPAFKGEDIRFDNVSFAYESKNILDGVSLTFEAGRKYALVGSSGCGKTTLINLICRFYEPVSGSIRVGDTDLKDMDPASLRRNITFVGQDHQLFHDTIGSNIVYGLPGEEAYDIESAAVRSCIAADVDAMPARFGTVIGDNGVTLSGGQKQRLALARVFLRDNEIVILDEATSAIDSETEQKIIANMLAVHADKTILTVSHRLSSIRHVDEIVCMDQGRVIERGTHEELVGKKGFYWKLFREQL